PDPEIISTIHTKNSIDLVIFVSKNAVRFGTHWLNSLPLNSDCVIAAVGPATQQALYQHGYSRVATGEAPYDSEALLASPIFNHVRSKTVLIVKGQGGRTYLADQLVARGAIVYTLDTYQRVLPEFEQGVLEACGQLNFVMFTSSESASNLLALLPPEYHDAMFQTVPIVGHPRIAETVARLGFKKKPIIAADPGDDAMFRAFKETVQSTETYE
ncbi:MAG: uroporphyrinogen-III synthase, partial [Planctomycetaceae bacterium]|nr:uroporphyrinogen-III synthase [Planctomycetaceae bacterium]